MDDMALWSDSSETLKSYLVGIATFLRDKLALELKPEPYWNRTEHGMEFLGCKVFRFHMILTHRSRCRFRHKLAGLYRAHQDGLLDSGDLQKRADSLVAFTRASGISSWRFRQSVIQWLAVNGQGLEPGQPGRQLEQRPAELPVGEPQQERAGEPEQQPGLPACPSSADAAEAVPDGTNCCPVLVTERSNRQTVRQACPVLVAHAKAPGSCPGPRARFGYV